MTSDTGLAYVDGDQTFNKEQAPCRFKIFSELFCRIDDAMGDIPKHMQAKLYPSEIVTLGLVFALKGVGERAFYRWLAQDHLDLFPNSAKDGAKLRSARKANHRWIVGSKLCFVLNKLGLIVAWDCATANVYDATFHALITQFPDIVLNHELGAGKYNLRNSQNSKPLKKRLQ